MATKRTATNQLMLASAQVPSAQSALLERFQTSLKIMILLDLFEIYLGRSFWYGTPWSVWNHFETTLKPYNAVLPKPWSIWNLSKLFQTPLCNQSTARCIWGPFELNLSYLRPYFSRCLIHYNDGIWVTYPSSHSLSLSLSLSVSLSLSLSSLSLSISILLRPTSTLAI